MADGRILAKRITRSKKVASLSSDTARMFYTWLIPYLDVEGRMEADPLLLKADIAPLLPHVTEKVIRAILDELHTKELIVLYYDGCSEYLQLTKFDENQPNLRKDREKDSTIPAPTAENIRIISGVTPDKLRVNIREVNIREEKIKYKDSVLLTEKEFRKLQEKYGEQLTDKAIDALNNYLMSSGKKYKSHYHTLLGWPMKEAKQAGGGSKWFNQNS